MTKLVTFETVAAAAQALVEAGEVPSVRKVQTALGGGSPNGITSFLAEWKAGRPAVSAETFQVSEAVLAAVSTQVKQAAIAAAQTAEARAADAEDTLALVREELTKLQHDADSLTERLAVAEDAWKTTARLAETDRAELDKTKQELAEMRLLADKRLSETSVLSTKNTALDEQVRRLEAELSRTGSALSEVQARAASAEQKAAMSAAQVDILTARISDGQSQIESLKASLTASEKRLADAEARHASAMEKAQAAHAAALEKAQDVAAQAGIERAKIEGRLAALTELKEVKQK